MSVTINGTTGLTFNNSSTQDVGSVATGSQTWTDVGASRSSGTTYTNSTGKPIQILVCTDNAGNTTYGAAGAAKYYINGSNVGQQFCSNAANIGGLFSAIIPNGATYSVTASTIRTWWELR